MATTLKYLEENTELTDDGYRLSEQMSYFNDAAWDADCATDDGDVHVEAIEAFWEMANSHPNSLKESATLYNHLGTIREAVLTLFAPKGTLARWQRVEIMEALAAAMTKKQLMDAFLCYGEAANEYFRLMWLVAEHGGWRKGTTATA